jgi:two-component system sensor histidine kinase MprB
VSFRGRVALIIAVCVASVVGVVTLVAYVYVRAEVNGGLDRSLRASLSELQRENVGGESGEDGSALLPRLLLKTRPGRAAYFVQLVKADGRVSLPAGAVGSLAIPSSVRRLAQVGGPQLLYNTEVQEAPVRVLAAPYGAGDAVLIAAPVLEVEHTLARLQLAAVLTGLGGAGMGAALGLLVTGATISPLRKLTDAAEQVARTRDLSTRLAVHGNDEVSRLTATFNNMLQALRDADAAQRRLVADASHELRTPLASLRVNVELLAGKGGRLPAAERRAVVEDIMAQARDLGVLMTGILDLARGQEQTQIREAVSVEEVVERALTTARRDWPDVNFASALEPWTVAGDAERLERAVTNVLGNAAKYAGQEGPIQVALRAGVLTVTDCGAGIAVGDRERVFERFYRAPNARDVPGSGLGLAIVRQAMTELGGTVRATTAEGGGAVLTLDLRRARSPRGVPT